MPTDATNARRAAFHDRARAFLDYVVSHADNPMTTVWGDYRRFDGYALAALAVGNWQTAKCLLGETLEMIDRNFADERANPNNKWHLADFAMHPLLRGYLRYREINSPDDPIWERLAETARQFLFHYGDLSENHNFLHLTLRYLVGKTWPDAAFADGRTGRVHADDARGDILRWMRDWARTGSAEWGADIYYNVNLLSLLNLYDFAQNDDAMREAAHGLLDLMALDEAVDAFAGSATGAARRSYAVYRMDVRQSPARPLHYLWFAPPDQREPFNLHFIGGVIQAATSDYLPPAPIAWIANHRSEPSENRATHLPGVWENSDADHLSKHTLRLPDVMQSVMNSPGGTGRYTEHVWQVTMSEEALIFANHPTLVTPRHPEQNAKTLPEIQAMYAASPPTPEQTPPGEAWYWNYANVPPGHAGDVRPGYWQGNGYGPRSFGTGALAFLIFNIPADNLLPFAHLYLPRFAFDEVREEDNGRWVFVRRSTAYAALFLPTGSAETTTGFWANTERKIHGNRSAALSFVSDAERDGGDFDAFIRRARRDLQPEWDAATLTLSARLPDAAPDQRIRVSCEYGPMQNNKPVPTKGARFETPWGTMPLGSGKLRLETPVGAYDLALPE